MKATMMLADAAQAVGGKLYILGGGWSVTGPEPTPSAIAIKIEVPWDEGNKRHSLTLSLLDADGHAVLVPTPAGDEAVIIKGQFETGRPPGLKPGTPLDAVLAITIAPLPLKPDNRFMWQLSIDDKTTEEWQVTFTTRPERTTIQR
jgi:hypothetical protein